MTVSDKIKNLIEDKGLKQKWVANKIGIPSNTFSYKLSNNTFSADDILKISIVLNIDLNKLAQELHSNLN